MPKKKINIKDDKKDTKKAKKTEVMLKLCTETMWRGLGTKCHHLRFMTHLVCVYALFNNLIKKY